jgi:TolB-like protein
VRSTALLQRLRERGVLRVAASYAVIAWLLLQIADVTFEPLGVPRWLMIALITTAVLGFPVAIMLAWHFELGDRGLTCDNVADAAARPVVHGLRRYADVAIIGVLLATVAALLVRQSDLAKPPPPDRPTIAVLPFANLSGDPEQEYFSDGLAQELLDRLGRVPGLAVIGRSSSFSLKGKGLDTLAVAERLGATTILEGAVRRDGVRLKVSATLLDGRTGRTDVVTELSTARWRRIRRTGRTSRRRDRIDRCPPHGASGERSGSADDCQRQRLRSLPARPQCAGSADRPPRA